MGKIKLTLKRLQRLFVFSFVTLFVGCNSLFYYPSNIEYQKLEQSPYQNFSVDLNGLGSDNQPIILGAHYFYASQSSDITVLHFHGNAQNMTAHFEFAKWMLDHGFNVMVFDYQGYGKSDGVVSREHTVQDGMAAIRYLEVLSKNHKTVAGKNPVSRVVIFGQSLGGAVGAVSAAMAQSPLVCGAVLESTFASYRLLARRKLAQFWLTWPLQWPVSFTVSDEYAPMDYVNKLNVPILFLHGSADHAVPLEEGRALYEAYSGTKQWIEIPKGGHTPSFIGKTSRYRDQTATFIRRACGEAIKD